MSGDLEKGFVGALSLRIEAAEVSAKRAHFIGVMGIVCGAVGFLFGAWSLVANRPAYISPTVAATNLDGRIAFLRNEVDAIAERAKKQIESIMAEKAKDSGAAELRARSIVLENGDESLTLTPFGLAMSYRQGPTSKSVFILVQERGRASMSVGTVSGSERIVINGSDPSISTVDGDGNDRAVLGVAHTVLKSDGATTKTSPANLTFFNKEGTVTMSLPLK